MKGKIFKNPFFCLSILLFGVLVFQVAGIVRGEGIWQGPTEDPPGGQPAAPLDTSSFPQIKQSNTDPTKIDLTIDDLLITGRFDVKGRLYVGSVVNDGVVIENTDPMIKFGPDGVGGAVIRFNRASNKLEARHSFLSDVGGDWFDIGSGGGIGGVVGQDWVLKYDGTRGSLFPGIVFRDDTAGKNMWKIGVNPRAYSRDEGVYANAWYLEQVNSITGVPVSSNPRLVVRDTGEVIISRLLSIRKGSPGIDNGLQLLGEGLSFAKIWLNDNKLYFAVNNTSKAMILDEDGKRACPTGYVKAGSVCVMANRIDDIGTATGRASELPAFYAANDYCADKGARLCSYGEWLYACQTRETSGANFGSGVWEWTDDLADGNNAIRGKLMGSSCAGDGGGSRVEAKSLRATGGFRCCIAR